jgi:type III pantothenate kinase
MALLIIDAGHTHLKFSLYGAGAGPERRVLPVRPFSWPEDLNQANIADEILLMGTNDRLQIRLQSHMAQGSWGPVRKLGVDLGVPIELNCSRKETGNDRQANALGATRSFPGKEILVVSFGSALVVDRVSAEGALEGGLIGLGRDAYAKAMADIRSCLTPGSSDSVFPGKNTSEAVALGWDEPTRHLLNAHGAKAEKIIFTGGGAEVWREEFPHAQVMPWLGQDAMAEALDYPLQ